MSMPVRVPARSLIRFPARLLARSPIRTRRSIRIVVATGVLAAVGLAGLAAPASHARAAGGPPTQPIDRRRPADAAIGPAATGASGTALIGPGDGGASGTAVSGSRRPPLSAAARRGASLYRGDTPLPGALHGHERALPPAATRCTNCHGAQANAPRTAVRPLEPGPFDTGSAAALSPSAAALADAANLGPPLDAASLTSLRARRGGPPSRFDAPALCTLLRTGLDPAQILIPQSMPRYAPTDADCRDLWAYLYERD